MDNSLLSDIRKKVQHKKRPRGFGITRLEYASAEGISENTAGRTLKELEELGILVSESMIHNKRETKVYYRKKSIEKKR